jgi:hypothetical protein
LQSRFERIDTSVKEPHGEERAPAGRQAGVGSRLLPIDPCSCRP